MRHFSIGQRRLTPTFVVVVAALALLTSLGALAQGWTDIGAQVSVDEGRGVYDRANRQYIATVTVTNTSGAALAGPIRLVIASTNKTVKSPDGTTGGAEPYFTLIGTGGELAAGESISKYVTFDKGRGRLSYSTRVEQEPAPSTDITGTISGTVTDADTGAALADVSITLGTETVEVSSGTQGTYTGAFGNGEVDYSPERGDHVMVTAEKDGYTSYQTQVSVAGEDGTYTADFSLVPIAASADVPNPSTTPVDLPAMDGGEQTGQLDIPPGSVLDEGGSPVTEPVTVEFTPIDPTDPEDLAAFPGADFVAAGGDPNNPTTLESVVLAEVTIVGESGMEYSDLATPATMELLLPDDMQSAYDVGDTIPLWYYDEDTGLWVEDGVATVQLCSFNGALKCSVFTVDHFTWWNVDQPITDHGCFKGTITQLDGTTPVTVPVRAIGVTYNGTSAGNRDYADPAVYGVSFKRSGLDGPPEPEQVKLFLYKDGQSQYLTNPVMQGLNTYRYDLTLDIGSATVFNSPNFSGSTIPNPDTGACQELNIRVDFNLAPVVSVTGPGLPQAPGATVPLSAVVTDADGNYDPSNPSNWDWSTTCGTLSNETATSADLTGSGGVEDCVVTMTATDNAGASGSDSELVRFTSGSFVPGDELTVTILDQRGQPVPSAWAFLTDEATNNPITSVTCDPDDDGACPADINGQVDFGGGFGGGQVILTVAADLGFTGGEELPVKRLITFRTIPAGALTVIVPGGSSGQPALSARSPAATSLFADLALGKPAQAVGAGGSYDLGVILDYVAPPGTAGYSTLLRPGTQAYETYPQDPPPNHFDVYMEQRELELNDLAAFIGFGLDATLGDPDDRKNIRYGVAVDQDPAIIGLLGSGNELHFALDKTAGLFDIDGPYAEEEENQVLAWRGGASYRIECDEPMVTRQPAQVTICDQFPSSHYFYVARGDGSGEEPVGFDSQMLAALPAAPGPIGTDELEVSVSVANGVIDSGSSTADVTLGGDELSTVEMLRTDFRGDSGGFDSVVWSVFEPAIGTPIQVATPVLPASLAELALVNPYGDCSYYGGAPTITAMALHQSAPDFYVMVQNARLMGDYRPIAPESTGVYSPEAWPDALWLITADRLQGSAGDQCIAGGYGGS